jgi:hypothetical protein
MEVTRERRYELPLRGIVTADIIKGGCDLWTNTNAAHTLLKALQESQHGEYVIDNNFGHTPKEGETATRKVIRVVYNSEKVGDRSHHDTRCMGRHEELTWKEYMEKGRPNSLPVIEKTILG